jgi:hypothetical protein
MPGELRRVGFTDWYGLEDEKDSRHLPLIRLTEEELRGYEEAESAWFSWQDRLGDSKWIESHRAAES